jgi:hypothetical protein
MAFTLQAFAEDTLSADITDSANSMTLTTGGFGTPTGEQMLVIDPDVASKREIVKCAIDGTAVTSMDRAQDGTAAVAHTSGAKIIMAFVPSHHEALKAGTDLNDNVITAAKLATKVKAGWDLLSATGTRASNTQMTIAGDITDRLWVGKPLELTDTTTKYFNVTSFSYSSPNTTINFTGGTDYVLEGNPTNIYGGLHASPVGFPGWFAYTPTLGGNASMTYGTTTINLARFKMDGNMVTLVVNHSGTVGGTPNTTITATLPVNCKDDYTYCANNIFNNGTNDVGYSAVVTSNQSLNSRIGNGGNWTAGAIIVRANICYEAA